MGNFAIYLLFTKEFKLSFTGFEYAYFILAFPFFLMEFTGLLQSKADLICVTFFLSKERIAQYQVYINFLLLLQSSAGFILAPYLKNIYRLKKDSIRKLSVKLLSFGIALAAISTYFISVFIRYFYHFSIPTVTLLLGAFFIIPIFYYITIVYQLLKINRQKIVLFINIAGTIISFILNIILIPHSSDGISGAILAITITQWLLLLMYWSISNFLSKTQEAVKTTAM